MPKTTLILGASSPLARAFVALHADDPARAFVLADDRIHPTEWLLSESRPLVNLSFHATAATPGALGERDAIWRRNMRDGRLRGELMPLDSVARVARLLDDVRPDQLLVVLPPLFMLDESGDVLLDKVRGFTASVTVSLEAMRQHLWAVRTRGDRTPSVLMACEETAAVWNYDNGNSRGLVARFTQLAVDAWAFLSDVRPSLLVVPSYIGPHLAEDTLAVQLIRRLIRGQVAHIPALQQQPVEFVHVHDAALAIDRALTLGAPAESRRLIGHAATPMQMGALLGDALDRILGSNTLPRRTLVQVEPRTELQPAPEGPWLTRDMPVEFSVVTPPILPTVGLADAAFYTARWYAGNAPLLNVSPRQPAPLT